MINVLPSNRSNHQTIKKNTQIALYEQINRKSTVVSSNTQYTMQNDRYKTLNHKICTIQNKTMTIKQELSRNNEEFLYIHEEIKNQQQTHKILLNTISISKKLDRVYLQFTEMILKQESDLETSTNARS